MSNLPLQLAVIHNDDNDDEQTTNNKLSTINSRITSPLIIKRQQNNETKIANNQAYDEIHDVQSKHSSIKKSNNDNSYVKSQSKLNNSHELMQGNYYDQTRFDVDYSSSSANLRSEPVLIDINLEDYKKTIAPFSTSKNSSNKNRASTPPFGDTSESIQHGIAQSAGILLELNKKPPHHAKTSSMKNNTKFHERAVINYFPKDTNEDDGDDNTNNKQRSLSSSSTSDCSTSDSSTSINCREESDKINSETNIPYETLLNDEDDDDLIELPKKPLTESTTLLNKNLSQTYGTQSTTNAPYERGKYVSNNGYNSHGSSITTKSSSDNSGSIRTNSGSDNDEESDEEHYNNSTLSNNPVSMSVFPCTNDTSIKSLNKSNDIGTSRHDDRFSYSSEQNSFPLMRSNPPRSEQINNNDEHHLQVPRFKQHSNDDPNGNNNKINSGTDHNIHPYTSKWSLQQPSIDQTNNLLSSSHQNRNLIEQQPHSNSSRNNSRQHPSRASKKRKQSQQQETIRTELIPGHRGDLDVDELVMFIDGNSSKQQQQQNSIPLRSIDPTTKPKQHSLTDINSNKNSSRKKSRKSIKIVQQSISSINTNENTTSNYLSPIQQDIQSISFIDEDEQTTVQPIVDITNQSLRVRNASSDNNNDDITSRISLPNNNNDESRLNTVVSDSTNNSKTTNGDFSLPNWFEQTRNTSLQHDEDGDSFSLSSPIANTLNSEIISEPFVTVTHRRRPVKERRPDNNLPRSSRFPPSSSSSTTNDKRRIQSTLQNGITHPTTRNSLSNIKPFIPSTSRVIKGENNIPTSSKPETSPPPLPPPPPPPSSSSFVSNTINEQSSPRLSSHSSSSSLSSLLKRQSKLPPVVFLNKSVDIELNDVSFGFDLDSTTLNKSSDDNNNNNNKPTTTETEIDPINTSTSPSTVSTQPNEISIDSSPQKYIRNSMGRSFQQQRNNRGPQFYSGSDIRPHHRNYPTQPVPQPPYIDPLLLLQYNQQRLASYNQQVAYMNLLRTQYLSQQPQYVLLPTPYTTAATTNETDPDEKPLDDETNQSSEQVQEPLLVYTTPTGQVYYQPASTKKAFMDIEQQQQQPTSIPTIYPTTTSTMYQPQFFYPTQQHLVPSHPAYFQPIPSSPALLVDAKSEQNSIDHDDTDHENSTKLYPQRTHQSSSDIMSNALQLVYSQQRRNAQTDRFNLDDLTAYLAMKWTEAADYYEQGDSRILLIDVQK